ncbi:MAG: hypothetical protein J6C93_05825 [Clostridia bacterium]|nr:hypothetical protein [Clostridia bacterium]
MKKLFKALVVATLAAISCIALVACGAKEYEGSYNYANPYSAEAPDYGVKVVVTVNGDKIEKVAIAESDWTQCSDTWEDKATYLDNEAAFLKAFEGKTVAEVKAYTVTVGEDAENTYTLGVPLTISAEGLDVIEGATQSCGRLILAVQNALKDVK